MIGKTLQNGKYEIKRVLGQGGFGITYEGVQTGLGRKVAIKEFFMKDFCERETGTSQVTIVGTEGNRSLVERFKEKFIKEAQMIAGLEDVPHIIRIYDIFQENGTAYYVMQFIEDGSLDSKVQKGGPLKDNVAIRYIHQMADALGQLHAQRIMHLDIKPANVLLHGDDIYIIDFGISKHYDTEGDATTTTPVGRSKGYAPIEQYRQGGVQSFSPETDIYSLGATAYFLVTGHTPPEATELIIAPIQRPNGISDSMWNVISISMSPNKNTRPHSIAEFNAILNKQDQDVIPGHNEIEVVPDSETTFDEASSQQEKGINSDKTEKVFAVRPNTSTVTFEYSPQSPIIAGKPVDGIDGSNKPQMVTGRENFFAKILNPPYLNLSALVVLCLLGLALYNVLGSKGDEDSTNHEYNIEVPNNSENSSDDKSYLSNHEESSLLTVNNQSGQNTYNGRLNNSQTNQIALKGNNHPNENSKTGSNNAHQGKENQQGGNPINQSAINHLPQNEKIGSNHSNPTAEQRPSLKYMELFKSVSHDYDIARAAWKMIKKQGYRTKTLENQVHHFIDNIDNNIKTLLSDQANYNALKEKKMIQSFKSLRDDIRHNWNHYIYEPYGSVGHYTEDER